MNQRQRERLSVEITGSGVLKETGESFTFQASDFSVMGIQITMPGVRPDVGQTVNLDFSLDILNYDTTDIKISGEIVRLQANNGDSLCGVRWMDSELPAHIDALESFYIERFFNSVD